MYQVSYDKTMKKEVPDEKLIEFIKSLQEEYQKSKPQVVVITKDSVVCFNLGVGDLENRSVLLYDDLSDPYADTLIAFNPDIKDFTRLNSFMSPYGYIAYSKSTIIDFQDVLNEIKYFSKNNVLSKNMMWHAH